MIRRIIIRLLFEMAIVKCPKDKPEIYVATVEIRCRLSTKLATLDPKRRPYS
jgi:hypothetical protein